MLFKPVQVTRIWDTWAIWDQGLYFLYYLVTERSPGEGFGLATSDDGVQWQDHGVIQHKSEGAQWLGTGSVWPAAPGRPYRFAMNYSEWFGPAMERGQQHIRLAVSDDLRRWDTQPELFEADPRHYRVNAHTDSRWDCISTLPRPGGGRYGYWTANPTDVHPGFGFGETLDDLHWTALAPPRIDWGAQVPPEQLEVGGAQRIGERLYMLAGSWARYGGQVGMFVLEADRPEGPFRAAAHNFGALMSTTASSYFARFLPSPDGLLVHHHAMTRSGERFVAPFKRAVVGPDGVLRLQYWPGNDRLRGPALGGAFERLADETLICTFAPHEGLWLEGALPTGCTLSLEAAEGALDIRLRPDGVTELGTRSGPGAAFTLEDCIDRALTFGPEVQLLLVLRGELGELYLNGVLMHCLNLPGPATGQIRVAGAGPTAPPLSAHRLTPALALKDRQDRTEPLRRSAW